MNIMDIYTLSALVGEKWAFVVGDEMRVPVVIMDVFSQYASEFGEILVEIIPLDSALRVESLTFEQKKDCFAEVRAQFGSTWVVYSQLAPINK